MAALPLKIRSADERDLDTLALFLKSLFSIEDDFGFNEHLQKKGLGLMLENERGCILVAETAGRVVGMCTGQLTISTAEGGPAVLVEDVVVQENYRGLGIGRQLMDAITRWGNDKGASRFQLLADQNNSKALEFYKKIGWVATDLICLRQRT